MFEVAERRVACSKNGCFVCLCVGFLVVTDLMTMLRHIMLRTVISLLVYSNSKILACIFVR